MNARNPVLAGRINAALDNKIPPGLLSANLRIVARTPWERYCGDAKARCTCRTVATSEMTGLDLESCGLELPKWSGDVGGIAHLTVILDAAARHARNQKKRDVLIANRDVLLEGLLDPIRRYTVRNRKAREKKIADQDPDQAAQGTNHRRRKRAVQHDYAYMARSYCKNELNTTEARAFFYVYCFTTALDILSAVESSPELSGGSAAVDFKQYSTRANEVLKETRSCSAEVLYEDCVIDGDDLEDLLDLESESSEERLRRLALPLYFEPVALAWRYGDEAVRPRAQASLSPTLSARLAAA